MKIAVIEIKALGSERRLWIKRFKASKTHRISFTTHLDSFIVMLKIYLLGVFKLLDRLPRVQSSKVLLLIYIIQRIAQ
jgi:hypothetical protein